MSSVAAENYQLKWHSHLSNLNSSVATLYRNDKFADVMLLTSNPDSSYGIPAHKIILSTCSHYFSSIFESNPSPPNSLIYIVLPPELSKKSIQILVQYMYSGEATVSNDILNEVLRGGELLKIRGLWRNNNNYSNENTGGSQTAQTHPSTVTSSSSSASASSFTLSSSATTAINHQKNIESHHATKVINQEISVIDKHLPEPKITSNNEVLKESPVVVMNPHQKQHESLATTSQQLTANYQQPQQNIIVKRDMAIDRGDDRIPSTHYGMVSLQIAAAVKKSQQQQQHSEILVKGLIENGSDKIQHSGNIKQIPEMSRVIHERVIPQRLSKSIDDPITKLIDKRRLSIAEVSRSSMDMQDHHDNESQSDVHHIPEELNFLTIKEEPVEWIEYDQHNGLEKQDMEIIVKPEMLYPDENYDEENSNDDQEPIYSPLTCELCSETFTIPAEWVRHIEGHAETPQTVPKKRRRLEDNSSDNIAALRCDLCSMYFITPAEWVRHVQNTHTETELAISNNSAPPKRNTRVNRPLDGQPLEKSCSVCNKTFPSYASMIIHKRTHTGEKPFYCSLCNKGFNVKSNLLRHMRTLHNQFINPSNINDNPDNSNSDD